MALQTVLASLILLTSIGAAGFALWAFVHSRLMTVDLKELERLRWDGLLPKGNTLEQDFATATALLRAIGAGTGGYPAAGWVRLYFEFLRVARKCLRVARTLASGSALLEMEMQRLVAYQVCRYRAASYQV